MLSRDDYGRAVRLGFLNSAPAFRNGSCRLSPFLLSLTLGSHDAEKPAGVKLVCRLATKRKALNMDTTMTMLLPELLLKIMLQAAARPGDARGEFEHWPLYYAQWRAPLVLASVCHRWHELVHSCSDMWSSLSYNITNHSVTNGGLIGVQTWLVRSGGRPLYLDFAYHYHDSYVLKAFLMTFYPHFSRLALLRIGMFGGVYGDIPGIPRVDMPWCRHVRTKFENEEYVAWFAPFFQNRVPALRELQMDRYDRSTVSHMPVEHHISNLTYLHAAANNFKMRPVDILRGCPHLVECWLYLQLRHDNSNGAPDDTVCEPFTLPNLRTFSIGARINRDWRDVFAHAKFPALEEMSLIGAIWPIPTLVPFLERSRSSLRYLSLSDCNAVAAEVIDVL